MSEVGPQVNGLASPTGKYIDHIDPDDPEYIKNLQRPAEVKEDLQQMENRSRVKVILNSQAFKEELEQVVEEQLQNGPFPTSLIALQQITDLLLPHSKGGLGSLARASAVIPINDLRGVESQSFVKGERLLRCKLAALYRLVDLCGWSHGINNHISARVSSENEHFLLNPFGLTYSEVTASTLIKVDVNGDVVDPGSTHLGPYKAGFLVHAAIHQARPDIRCIVHLHTPAAVAVSALKCGLLPMSQEALICGNVSYHDFQGVSMDAEERDKLTRNLGVHNKILILRNRGVLSCGETVEEAFHYTFNVMAACEAQVKAIPLGLDNIVIPSEEVREQAHKTAAKQCEIDPKERKWKIGELEFEALMRTLDNSGYRTGYPYKMPIVKQEKKERSNSEVEIPPSSSSFTYIFDGDYIHSKYASPLQAARDRQKNAFKAGWLTTPNAYKKTEIDEIGTTTPKKITRWVSEGDSPGRPGATHVKIENPNQFAPQGKNPKEYKEKQKSIKKDYYEEKVTAGPQSKILEGITWDEAQKAKDGQLSGTGDQLIIVGAASKGIIQRDHQHNAVVYRQYYAANPFENMSEAEIEQYQSEVQKKERGEPVEEQAPQSPIEVEVPTIKQPPPEPEKEEIEDPRVDVTDTVVEPPRPEWGTNGLPERATSSQPSEGHHMSRKKKLTTHIADKVVHAFCSDILSDKQQNMEQQSLTGANSVIEDPVLTNQVGDNIIHRNLYTCFGEHISENEPFIDTNCSSGEDCISNNGSELYSHILCTDDFKNSQNITWGSVIEAEKGQETSRLENDFVRIQLNPIELYHGRAESGAMKVRFSVQSTVRRIIRSELSRGGDGAIEEVSASISEPFIEHFLADDRCFEQSVGLETYITNVSVKRHWKRERQSSAHSVQPYSATNRSNISKAGSDVSGNNSMECSNQHNLKSIISPSAYHKVGDDHLVGAVDVHQGTGAPVIDTGQIIRLNKGQEEKGKQTPNYTQTSGREGRSGELVKRTSPPASTIVQSDKPFRDSGMAQNNMSVGISRWDESWNKDIVVRSTFHSHDDILLEDIKYADEGLNEDFDAGKKLLEENLKPFKVQAEVNTAPQKIDKKKRILDRRQMPPPPLPPLLKPKNFKGKNQNLRQKIKQTYPSLSPVKEEFGGTVEEIEEMEAILEEVDDSFEQLLLSAEDDLLISPKIDQDVKYKRLTVTDFVGAAPMATEEDFDSQDSHPPARHIDIGRLTRYDHVDQNNPLIAENFPSLHLSQVGHEQDLIEAAYALLEDDTPRCSSDEHSRDSQTESDDEFSGNEDEKAVNPLKCSPSFVPVSYPEVLFPSEKSCYMNSLLPETLTKSDQAVLVAGSLHKDSNFDLSSGLEKEVIEGLSQTHMSYISDDASLLPRKNEVDKSKDSVKKTESGVVEVNSRQTLSNHSALSSRISGKNQWYIPSMAINNTFVPLKHIETTIDNAIPPKKIETDIDDVTPPKKIKTKKNDIPPKKTKTNIDVVIPPKKIETNIDDVIPLERVDVNVDSTVTTILTPTNANIFAESKVHQVKNVNRLNVDEGPVQTSSPKMGRARSKESPFKPYLQKLGKSEETLLDIMPLKRPNPQIGAKSQEQLESTEDDEHVKLPLSRSKSLGPHHVNRKNQKQFLYTRPNEPLIEDFLDSGRPKRERFQSQIAVLDQYNLMKHSRMMESSTAHSMFKSSIKRTNPVVGDVMPPLPDTTEVPSVSDNEGQSIAEDYNLHPSSSRSPASRRLIVANTNNSSPKQKWVPKQKRERQRRKWNLSDEPENIGSFAYTRERAEKNKENRRSVDDDSERLTERQKQQKDIDPSERYSNISRTKDGNNHQAINNEEEQTVNERGQQYKNRACKREDRSHNEKDTKDGRKNSFGEDRDGRTYKIDHSREKGYKHDKQIEQRTADIGTRIDITSEWRKSNEYGSGKTGDDNNSLLSNNNEDSDKVAEEIKETIEDRKSHKLEQSSVGGCVVLSTYSDLLEKSWLRQQQTLTETQYCKNDDCSTYRNKDVDRDRARKSDDGGGSRSRERGLTRNEEEMKTNKKEIMGDYQEIKGHELEKIRIDGIENTRRNERKKVRTDMREKIKDEKEETRKDKREEARGDKRNVARRDEKEVAILDGVEEARRNKDNVAGKYESEEARRDEIEDARRYKREEAIRDKREDARRDEREEARRDKRNVARRDEDEKAGSNKRNVARRDEKEEAIWDEVEEARRNKENVARRYEREDARRDEREEARRDKREDARRDEREEARKHEREEARRDEREEARRDEREEVRKDEREEARRSKRNEARRDEGEETRRESARKGEKGNTRRDGDEEAKRDRREKVKSYGREDTKNVGEETRRDSGRRTRRRDEKEDVRRNGGNRSQSYWYRHKEQDEYRFRAKYDCKENETSASEEPRGGQIDNTIDKSRDSELDRNVYEDTWRYGDNLTGISASQVNQKMESQKHAYSRSDRSQNESGQLGEHDDYFKKINSANVSEVSASVGTQHLPTDSEEISEKVLSSVDLFLNSNRMEIDPNSSPRLHRRRGGAIAYLDNCVKGKEKWQKSATQTHVVMDSSLQDSNQSYAHHKVNNGRLVRKHSETDRKKQDEEIRIVDKISNNLEVKSCQEYVYSTDLVKELPTADRSDPSPVKFAHMEQFVDPSRKIYEASGTTSFANKSSHFIHPHKISMSSQQSLDRSDVTNLSFSKHKPIPDTDSFLHESDRSRFAEEQHTKDTTEESQNQNKKNGGFFKVRRNIKTSDFSDKEITEHVDECLHFSNTDDVDTVSTSSTHQHVLTNVSKKIEKKWSDRDFHEKYPSKKEIKIEKEMKEPQIESRKVEVRQRRRGIVESRKTGSSDEDKNEKKLHVYKDSKDQQLSHETIIRTRKLGNRCLPLRRTRNAGEEAADNDGRGIVGRKKHEKDYESISPKEFSKWPAVTGDKEHLPSARRGQTNVSEVHMSDEEVSNVDTRVEKKWMKSGFNSVNRNRPAHDHDTARNVSGSPLGVHEKQKYAGFIKRTGRSVSKSHPTKSVILSETGKDLEHQDEKHDKSLTESKMNNPEDINGEDHMQDFKSLIHENPIEVNMDDGEEEKAVSTKKGILNLFSCVGGKSASTTRKTQKQPKKQPTAYYEEGEKRKIKKLSRQKDNEEKKFYYFEEPNDDHENNHSVNQSVDASKNIYDSVNQSVDASKNIYEYTTKEALPSITSSHHLPSSPRSERHKKRISVQSSRLSGTNVDPSETLEYSEREVSSSSSSSDDDDEDGSCRWKNRRMAHTKEKSTYLESRERDLSFFSSFGKANISASNTKFVMRKCEQSEHPELGQAAVVDKNEVEQIFLTNSEESLEVQSITEDNDKSTDMKPAQFLLESDLQAQTGSDTHFLLRQSSSPEGMKNDITSHIPEIIIDVNDELSETTQVRLGNSELLQFTEMKDIAHHLSASNDVTPPAALERFDSSEEYPSFRLNSSAPAHFNIGHHKISEQRHALGSVHDHLDNLNESHHFDLTYDQSMSFDTADIQHRRNQRNVSFDDGFRALRRHISETSIETKSHDFRPRSASTVSNPLIYEPWRVKADKKKRSLSVSEMTYPKGVARPVRTRSVGEIYNSTVASSVARRRAKARQPSDITSRMYQPRQHNRSHTSLGNTSFGSLHPTRQRSFSGFDYSTRSSVRSPDHIELEKNSESDYQSCDESDASFTPVTVKRSESDRQPSQSHLKQQLIEDKPTTALKSDTIKSTDSASGGETLEERSSKEGSPTKEHLSPTKEKKKKKKFHIPSFSKKKSKESKESAA